MLKICSCLTVSQRRWQIAENAFYFYIFLNGSFISQCKDSYFRLLGQFSLYIHHMRLRYLFLLIMLLFGSLIQCKKTDDEREANRLFVEAYQLTEAAREKENSDPADAYERYQRALRKIEQIISNYSDTQIAVDVAQHRTSIGDITIGDLRKKVPAYAARAEALEDFHQLTLYAIEMESDVLNRGLLRLEYARKLIRNSRQQLHDELVGMVVRQADQHWNREVTDRLYHDLSVHFSEQSRWGQSIEMADRIQDPSLLSGSLERLISSGYITSELNPRSLERVYDFVSYVDPVGQVKLIGSISRELFASGRGTQANALLRDRLPSPENDRILEHIEALTGLATTFSEAGEFDVSRDIIRQIGNLDSDYMAFALRDLASQVARHDGMDEAMVIVEGFDRDYFRYTTMAAIAVQQAHLDSLDSAMLLLDRIPDNVSEKTESLLEISWIAADEEEEIADSLLQLAMRNVAGMTASMQRSDMYLRIADIQIRLDRRSLAARAVENAESDARDIVSPESLNHLIARIIECWITLGRPDRALDIAAWFRMSDSSFDALVPELYSFTISRGYHDFVRSLAGMTDRRAQFQYRLVEAYLDMGLISQPSELAYDIRNYYWRSLALARLAYDLKSKVNLATAEKAATDALLTIQRIRESDEKQQALTHASALISAAEITMNEERRSLAVELLNNFEL